MFANRVLEYYDNAWLSDFLYMLDVDEFFNNLTRFEYVVDNKETGDQITIPKNIKVVKAFKFFENNETLLKEIQIEASRIIQEVIVSGYLCLSVHPLDYLSASENVHNWRSCHALDGDYRVGNLNYMMDTSTVICYLKADKNAILPRFPETVPWNSKKWRVWIFFSQDRTMLFAGRPYPFFSQTGLDLIKDKLLPSIGLDNWSKFCRDKIYTSKDYYSNMRFGLANLVPVGQTAIPIKELVKDGTNTFHYNDLLKSSFYEPLWSYRLTSHRISSQTGCTNNLTKFFIGSSCVCPICGKRLISFSNCMACAECAKTYNLNTEQEELEECEICGNFTWYDEMFKLPLSGLTICPRCYNNYTIQCQDCGIIDLQDVIKIRYKNFLDYRYLCQNCYEAELNKGDQNGC